MRAVTLASLVVILLGCPPPVPPAGPGLRGPGWELSVLDGGALVYARDGGALVTLPPEAFQVGTVRELDADSSYDPYWLVVNDGVFSPVLPVGFRWRVPVSAAASMDGDALLVTLGFEGTLQAAVRGHVADDGHLVLRLLPGESASPIAYLRLRAGVSADEAFYGLGEWFDGSNHRGHLRPLQLEADLNSESGSTENHVSVPYLVGSHGWGLFVETRRHGVVDVAKTDPAVVDAMFGTAEASGDGLTVHLFSAEQPLDIARQYYGVTGFPRPPSDWATGPWLWRDESRDQAEVEADVRTLRELDLPTSGIWIDRPYASQVNSFDFDPARYPDAGGMVAEIRGAGLKLALWHTPYVAPAAQPMRGEAEAQGLFPVAKGTQLNPWSEPLDFTKPAAVTFWRNLLTRYTSLGVEGFKLDFAEDVVAGLSGRRSGWTFANGETDRTMTDGYPRRYHDAYRAVLANNDGFLLVRHARWGEQQTGVVVWPGDIDATLTRAGERFTPAGGGNPVVGVGGLPAAIRAGIGLSMSGFPFFASDTGGYRHSPPDKETWLRWVEHAALMPVMQTGDSSSQPPWVFTPENGRDQEALDAYRVYARLHLRLFPFFWSHVEATRRTGRPVVRPYGLQFPSLGVHPEDAYALGDDLLVAPVETRGATSRALVKPPGRWFSWWDGSELMGAPGAEVTVSAGLTELPLFLREGALVPMLRPTIDTLSPAAADAGVDSFATEAGDLWVRAQPGEGRFELFDGTVLTQAGGTLTATAGSRFVAGVVWELRGVAKPAGVEHGGAALAEVGTREALEAAATGWWHGAGVLLVKTPLDGQATTLR